MRLTCTTFVRSKQSMQLTRNTAFCSDIRVLLENQVKLQLLISQNLVTPTSTTYLCASNILSSRWMSVAIFSYLMYHKIIARDKAPELYILHAFGFGVEIIFSVPNDMFKNIN